MKNVALRVALATALVSSSVVAGLTPAKAIPVTWDFIDPASNPGPGSLSTTATFFDTTNIYSITAYGIKNATYLPNTNPPHSAPSVGSTVTTSAHPSLTDLYVKNGGSGENGIGLKNDPTGDHEITLRKMVEIATNPNVGLYQFKMNSTTNHEGWDVYGSNGNAATGSVTLTLLYSDGTDQSSHSLSGYTYYYFTYDGAVVQANQGDNVLLSLFTGSSINRDQTTPLPAALPLFATGLGAMGLLGWRRKRKNAVLAG